MSKTDYDDIKEVFDICISSNYNDKSINPLLLKEYQLNWEHQRQNICFNKYKYAMNFFKNAINQNIDDCPKYLWTNGYEADMDDDEKNIIQMMRFILTDFCLNCNKPFIYNDFNERTPFIENLIPIFKAFGSMNNLTFAW